MYALASGKAPFEEWKDGLKDKTAQQKIDARIARVRAGNFGDHRTVGQGVFELRINYVPGYRVYCGIDGLALVILLCGGDKSTQKADIKTAHGYWSDYRSEI
jgi:putative addiction module killer protein